MAKKTLEFTVQTKKFIKSDWLKQVLFQPNFKYSGTSPCHLREVVVSGSFTINSNLTDGGTNQDFG